MNIGWPEGIWIALVALNLIIAFGKDGEPKTDSYSLSKSMLGASLGFGLLYWGGFFA